VRAALVALLILGCQRTRSTPPPDHDHDDPPALATSSGNCAEVVARIHQAVQHQIDLVGSAATTMMASMFPAMQEACEQDGWPDALKQCVIATTPGDLAALQACNHLMPQALQDKLQKRTSKFAPKPP
jgi:hypothetical protein